MRAREDDEGGRECEHVRVRVGVGEGGQEAEARVEHARRLQAWGPVGCVADLGIASRTLNNSTPTHARTMKKKETRRPTVERGGNAASIELTSTGMPGTRLSARSGRKARTERMALMLP